MPPKRKITILERATDILDLPSVALAGLPLLELVADKELRMENHKGILAYSDLEIHISAGTMIYKIQGTNLEIRSMTPLELVISGIITGISLE